MYNFTTTETKALKFWDENKIYSKAKKKNEGKKIFYYLDGPPYTSGKIHLGHAWGKALRDAVLRYKRMAGVNVWDRAGFDMHGLPTEKAVEAKFGIKDKDEVVKSFGLLKYIQECERLSVENMNGMKEDFKRMGVWMDFDNPYMPINNSYIEGVWWLVKKAHENGRLYEGLKTMPWCANCASANAKHELEYETVKDQSIFVKFKVVGKENEYLLIWTTTPWTIPFNLGVMANPDLDYVKCKVIVDGKEEFWILAEALANIFFGAVAGKKYEIVEKFKGTELEGLKYEHPFAKDISQFKEIGLSADKLHTVLLSSEYVDTSAGTGLVHCAPGCGPEDYEVGVRNGLPAFNTLTEQGVFDSSIPRFKGLRAKKDDKKFIEAIKENGALIETTDVEHEYPHCWRCHNPVVFRTTKQWFFKIEDLKENMREINKDIYWVPDWAGNKQFDSWLNNLRDNSISKQRFWGTPLPIWKAVNSDGKFEGDNDYIVIGSAKELEKYGCKVPENLHKPWIDDIVIEKDGKKYKRVLDVLDVWVDAGCASWLCLDYPVRTDLFEKMFEPDLILEGKDQIRGWFNILFVASMVAMNRPAFKMVYMHGFVNDALGRKFSKSLKNGVSPYEVIDKYGADTLRYYTIGGALPGLDLNYNMDDMKVKFRNLGILENLKNFLIDFAKQNGFDKNTKPGEFAIEEKFMLSRLNHVIKDTTENFESYNVDRAPWSAESAFLDLSRGYIQLIREKAVSGNLDEKKAVFYVIYHSLLEGLKLLAPVIPFLTEDLYQELRKEFGLEVESVHLFDWPKYDSSLVDLKLEKAFEIMGVVNQALLAIRDKEKVGVRWPLKNASIVVAEKYKEEYDLLLKIVPLIKQQVNVKTVDVSLGDVGIEAKVEGGFRYGEVKLDLEITKELEEEGFARELTRRIQALRKKAGLKKQDNIELFVNAGFDVSNFKKEIMDKVGAVNLEFGKVSGSQRDSFDIRGKKFEIGFDKV